MRKNALTICCFACAAGAIGAFCRWLQNQLAFDESRTFKAEPAESYAVEILAIAAALLGFYYMAGYAFGRVKPRSALYFDMLGAFLCIVSLADDGNFGEKLMFAAAASMLLFWAWMIVENLYLPEPAAPEAVPEPPEAPISEHDIPSIIEEVKSEEKQP
jgi:fluoride ion exporter CrcB/FEX